MRGSIEKSSVEESDRLSNSRRMPNQNKIDHFNQQTSAVKTKQLLLNESGCRSFNDDEIQREGSVRIALRRDANKFAVHSTGGCLSIERVWRNETDRKFLGSAIYGALEQLSPQQHWRNIRTAGDDRGCSALNLTRQTSTKMRPHDSHFRSHRSSSKKYELSKGPATNNQDNLSAKDRRNVIPESKVLQTSASKQLSTELNQETLRRIALRKNKNVQLSKASDQEPSSHGLKSPKKMSIDRIKISNVDADEENKGGAGYHMATQDVISEEKESYISEDCLKPRKPMRDQSDQSGGRSPILREPNLKMYQQTNSKTWKHQRKRTPQQ